MLGFHNWLFFMLEERKGNVDYHGFSKKLGFGQGKGGIMKSVFEWEGYIKPASSIFMGLSPELELAIYTLCVLLKPGMLPKMQIKILSPWGCKGGPKFWNNKK